MPRLAGPRLMALVGIGLLVAPVWIAPPAEAATVELRRWQEADLGPHLSFSFVLPAPQSYPEYFFGAEGGGTEPPEDAALGWLRVRVISSSQVICTGVVVHPGRELSDVFRPCNLETGHHYDLDWFVDSPGSSLVLYGRN